MADQTDYIRKVLVEEHVANSAAKFHADEITKTHDDDALKFDKFSWHDFELIEPDEINRDQFFDELLMFTGIFQMALCRRPSPADYVHDDIAWPSQERSDAFSPGTIIAGNWISLTSKCRVRAA